MIHGLWLAVDPVSLYQPGTHLISRAERRSNGVNVAYALMAARIHARVGLSVIQWPRSAIDVIHRRIGDALIASGRSMSTPITKIDFVSSFDL